MSASSTGTGLEHILGVSNEMSPSRKSSSAGLCEGATRSSKKLSLLALSVVDGGTSSGSIAGGAGLAHGSTGVGSVVVGAELASGGAGAGCHGSVWVSFDSFVQTFTCVAEMCVKTCTLFVPPGFRWAMSTMFATQCFYVKSLRILNTMKSKTSLLYVFRAAVDNDNKGL